MTSFDRPSPQPVEAPRPQLNLVDIHGGPVDQRTNVNTNVRNDNNLNSYQNQDVRVNTGPNTSDSRSNSNSNSNSTSRSDANSNSNSNSNSSSRVGDTSATGGSSRANGGSSQINESNSTKYYGGSATAPNVIAGGFCNEGSSTGVYVLGFGISGGKTSINESCMKKEDFQRTMAQVCRSSDEHAQVALQGFQLELQAGQQADSNPYAKGVGAGARRIANAKAEVSLQLDSVCSTLSNTADATMDALKRSGLDRPIIIPAESNNAAEQRQLDEALARKVESLDTRVQKVEATPAVTNVYLPEAIKPEPPKPVHRSHPQQHGAAAAKDDCLDAKKGH